MNRELLQQALDALKYHRDQTRPIHSTQIAIHAIEDYLAAPQPEPVGYMSPVQLPVVTDPIDGFGVYVPMRKTACGKFTLALYAAAPPAAPAPAVSNDATLNTLARLFHNGEEIEGDNGAAMMVDMSLWNEGCEALESILGDGDSETLASPAAPPAAPAPAISTDLMLAASAASAAWKSYWQGGRAHAAAVDFAQAMTALDEVIAAAPPAAPASADLANLRPGKIEWVPVPSAPLSCNKVPPGNGYCDYCARGEYEKCRYTTPVAPPAAPAVPLTDEPADGDRVEAAIDDYIDGYVMEGDDGFYQPNDGDRAMMKDAMMGLLVDPDFLAAYEAQSAAPAVPLTYSSTQATKCASCGQHKHTPLRIDAMGGYVCLTCIDQKLGSLLGEFGYPESASPAVPLTDDQIERMADACPGITRHSYILGAKEARAAIGIGGGK